MTRSGPSRDVRADAVTDHRIVLVATAAATLAVTIYTSLQGCLLSGCPAVAGGGVAVRATVGAAVVAPVVMLSAVHLLRPERYGYLARCLSVVAIAVGAALTLAAARAVLAAILAPDAVAPTSIGEYVSAAVAAACAVGLGLVQVDVARRIRHAEREQSIAQARAAGLVAELQEEELRLRYELAETIHGSVQGTFVVMEARLRHLALSTAHADAGVAGELHAVADQLQRLRERELRALSGRLYPVDLERGLAPAVRALVVRLPPSVAVTAPDDAVFSLSRAASRTKPAFWWCGSSRTPSPTRFATARPTTSSSRRARAAASCSSWSATTAPRPRRHRRCRGWRAFGDERRCSAASSCSKRSTAGALPSAPA